jgi:hypothetical protein
MATIDHEVERNIDVNKIKDSVHTRKVIVAGPGTGKSYLFSQLIKKKKSEGKTKFLAITFIGKLGDALADDLCGLAETMTMHGFARRFFLELHSDWVFYPHMYEVIKADLALEGITEFQIGDDNYRRKTKEYKSVGNADVVYYAVQICKKDIKKIPIYDLILIDEYQDFNQIESEFVDILAQKNEVVIVGDDDQALYEFKGSSPEYIRAKHDSGNTMYESHTLRFCSRCTEVIINYFHNLVSKFNLNDPVKKRIQKDYLCYVPDKKNDSAANSKIHLIKNCPPGMIAYKVHTELEKVSRNQKIKDALIIGEGRSCETILRKIAGQLNNYGFRGVDYKEKISILSFEQDVIDAYKFIFKNKESLIGWRILKNPDSTEKKRHLVNAKTLNKIINDSPNEIKKIKDILIDDLEKELEKNPVSDKELRKELLFKQLKRDNTHLTRPLCNIDITICNILNSKGLGADIVFLVGFDEGRFPVKQPAVDSEIYQMLVAITRAKKRLYLVNTVGKNVSQFLDCIEKTNLETEVIKN